MGQHMVVMVPFPPHVCPAGYHFNNFQIPSMTVIYFPPLSCWNNKLQTVESNVMSLLQRWHWPWSRPPETEWWPHPDILNRVWLQASCSANSGQKLVGGGQPLREHGQADGRLPGHRPALQQAEQTPQDGGCRDDQQDTCGHPPRGRRWHFAQSGQGQEGQDGLQQHQYQWHGVTWRRRRETSCEFSKPDNQGEWLVSSNCERQSSNTRWCLFWERKTFEKKT